MEMSEQRVAARPSIKVKPVKITPARGNHAAPADRYRRRRRDAAA